MISVPFFWTSGISKGKTNDAYILLRCQRRERGTYREVMAAKKRSAGWTVADLSHCQGHHIPWYKIKCLMYQLTVRVPNRINPRRFTWNLQSPPMSSVLSKQTGSRPSSRQHLIDVSPLTPAPITAILLLVVMVSGERHRAGSPESVLKNGRQKTESTQQFTPFKKRPRPRHPNKTCNKCLWRSQSLLSS